MVGEDLIIVVPCGQTVGQILQGDPISTRERDAALKQ